MAELAVSGAVVLVEIVLPLLSEISLQRDVEDGIRGMKRWLDLMKCYMEKHSSDVGGDNLLEHKVDEVRDIAYDIEDVLDEFALHSQPYTFHNHRISRKLHSFRHNLYHLFPHHQISKKIAGIKTSIDEMLSHHASLSNGNSTLRPSSSSTDMVQHRPPDDDELLGYDEEKNLFTDQLLHGDKRLFTLAVVGRGGSGKTAFVNNVLQKQGIARRFDCQAWVHVSRHFEAEQLFISMLKQLCASRKEPLPIDDGTGPQRKMQKYLTGKRFIVVLDDIWSRKAWNVIKGVFPNASHGSRIIVTTRSSDIASICVSFNPSSAERPRYIHNLTGLEWLRALTLFYRKAFPDRDGQCPPELKDCSRRIVTRCGRLPLAIVKVGDALSHKPRHPNVWENFHNSLGCDIMSDPNLSDIGNDMLLPSYLDLSSNLKSCFLYFSVFPKDYSVERGRLIRLWVAEKFAVATASRTAEEVAEGHLGELIQRNLVDVSKWDFDGRPRNCRVEDLVHAFITDKCKYENFASVFPSDSTSQSQKIRRLSVHNNFTHLPRDCSFSGVRSLFLLRLLEISTPDFEKIFCQLNLVRVLDFQDAPITEFPKDITHLTLLRHLSFRGTKINTIPSSIKKLSFLETLDLKQTDVNELPKEISRLHNLRHLFAYKYIVDNYVVFDSVRGVKIYKGIGNLTNLQKLSLVKVGKKVRILEELKTLMKLRKLGLMGLEKGHGEELCASIEHMQHLRTLNLCANTKGEFLELGEMSNPPLKLERLYLKGRLNQFPTWISSLDNLLKIVLKWSKMSSSPLQALQQLPNLTVLELVDCYIGVELTFEASSFQNLEILVVEDFSLLHTINIRDGAMPNVKKISLRKCPQVMIFPLGMSNLAKVEELTLHDMAPEFIARLRKNGEDRAMVTHIPLIHSFTLKNQSWSREKIN